MIILLSIILGVIIIYYYYQKFSRSSRCFETIPGPRSLPLVGNMLEFMLLDKKTMWDYFQNLSNKYYPRGKLMVFFTPLIALRDPNDLQIYIMNPNTNTKGYLYKYFKDWFNDGIFTTTGIKWQVQRKLAIAGFNFNALIRNAKIIDHYTKKTIEGLRSKSKKNNYELKNVASQLLIASSFATLADIDQDKLDQTIVQNLIKSIDIMVKVVMSRTLHPYLPRWFYFNKFTSYGRKNLASLGAFHKLTQELLRKYEPNDRNSINLIRQGILDESDIENDNFPLELMLKAQQDGILNEVEVHTYITNAFFGVYDTTRVSLSFTLLLLADHKEIQDRARDEVTAVLEESGGKLEWTELKKLNYLELCIKEALRMFPIIPMLNRYTEADVALENQVIPAGTEVIFRIFDLHRDPKYWPEPNKYDPDRFSPERIKDQHPFAYLPFSAGPRNCIGRKHAMTSMKSIIGRILYNFYLEPIDHIKDLTYIADVMLNTAIPFRAKFIRIDRD